MFLGGLLTFFRWSVSEWLRPTVNRERRIMIMTIVAYIFRTTLTFKINGGPLAFTRPPFSYSTDIAGTVDREIFT